MRAADVAILLVGGVSLGLIGAACGASSREARLHAERKETLRCEARLEAVRDTLAVHDLMLDVCQSDAGRNARLP